MAGLSRDSLQVDTYDMLDSYPASYKPKGSIRRPIIKAVDEEETDDEEGPRVRSGGLAVALSSSRCSVFGACAAARATQLSCGMRVVHTLCMVCVADSVHVV